MRVADQPQSWLGCRGHYVIGRSLTSSDQGLLINPCAWLNPKAFGSHGSDTGERFTYIHIICGLCWFLLRAAKDSFINWPLSCLVLSCVLKVIFFLWCFIVCFFSLHYDPIFENVVTYRGIKRNKSINFKLQTWSCAQMIRKVTTFKTLAFWCTIPNHNYFNKLFNQKIDFSKRFLFLHPGLAA